MGRKWLVIYYDGNQMRALMVLDQGLSMPFGFEGSDAYRSIESMLHSEFQVNAIISLDTGEAPEMIVIEDQAVAQMPFYTVNGEGEIVNVLQHPQLVV